MMLVHQLGQGGVERVTLHLANGLAARGNRVSLLLLRPGGALEDRLGEGVELIRPPRPAGPRRGLSLLRFVPFAAAAVRERRPDVLLSPGNHLHLLALLAHHRSGACSRLVLKLTNPVQRPGLGRLRNAFRERVFRFAAGHAEQVLALSPTARDEAARLAPGARVTLVDNPYLDEALLWRPAPAKARPPLLLSVGRLSAQKDPLLPIEALAGLRGMEWRLAVLGEGPLRSAIEARVAALGLGGRVELAGFVADPWPWFERSAIFLLHSRFEELPAVLFEALAARCRIVATAASPSVEAALAGTSARLVPPGDSAAFRSAIADALRDPAEPEDAGGIVGRFTIRNGVESHARALGLL